MTEDIARIQDWLVSAECRRQPPEAFFTELARRLSAAGLPLWRMRCTVLAMHPGLLGQRVHWERDRGIQLVLVSSDILREDGYLGSPVQAIFEGAARVRQRLARGELGYAHLDALRAAGATDYLAVGLDFGTERRSFLSLATDATDGFDDDCLLALERLLPALETRLELETTRYSMRTLLQVYLGPNAAERVMSGDFRRGTGQRIEAAIWLCDLRGFTSLADRLPVEEVVPVLDAYFEAMAGPLASGGEILKFIGDSILAVFPVRGDAAAAARNAVKAAEASIEAFARSPVAAAHALQAGVAVHLGEVMYGNIGARERLDFTVIGAAVNETARMEGMCKALKTSLVLSETVARHLAPGDCHPLGTHGLRGVTGEKPLFTLAKFAPPR
jgi:adenylate cyclase